MRKLCITLVMLLPAVSAFGFFYPKRADTPSGTIITNKALVTYSNRAGTTSKRSNTAVERVTNVYGLQVITNTGPLADYMVAPGETVYLGFFVFNAGNTNALLSVTNVRTAYLGGSANWATNQLFTDVDNDGVPEWGVDTPHNGTNFAMTEDATNWFLYKISAASIATDGRAMTNQFRVTNVRGLSTFSTYTGYKPFTTAAVTNWRFGGPKGYGRTFNVIVGGPDLLVTKTLAISNTGSYLAVVAAGAGDVVPGTKLTYTIRVTNQGGGEARSLVIADAIPPDCTYASNSMKWSWANGTYDTGATNLSDIAGEASGYNALGRPDGAYSTGGNGSVTFTFYQGGSPTTALSAKGLSTSARKVYFQVVVK